MSSRTRSCLRCASRTATRAVTLWRDEESADAGLVGGRSFYAEQLEKFVTIYRSPPGREHYDVVVADLPAAVPG